MGFQAFSRSSRHKNQALWPPGAPYQIGLAKPRSSASLQSGILFLSFFASLPHSTESVHHVPCSVECCLLIPLLCLTPPHAAWPPFPMPCWLYAVFCSPGLCYLTPHGLTNTLCPLLNDVFSPSSLPIPPPIPWPPCPMLCLWHVAIRCLVTALPHPIGLDHKAWFYTSWHSGFQYQLPGNYKAYNTDFTKPQFPGSVTIACKSWVIRNKLKCEWWLKVKIFFSSLLEEL